MAIISPIEQYKEIHEHFTCDEEQDVFTCQQGKILTFIHFKKEKQGVTYSKVYSAKRQDCKECPILENCLSKTSKYKKIATPFGHEEMRKNHRPGSISEALALNLKRMVKASK